MVHFTFFCMGKIIFNLFCLLFLWRKKNWFVFAWFFKKKVSVNAKEFWFRLTNNKKKLQLQNVFPLPEKNKKYFLKLWVDDLEMCTFLLCVSLLENMSTQNKQKLSRPLFSSFYPNNCCILNDYSNKKKQKKAKHFWNFYLTLHVFHDSRTLF